MLSSMSSLRQCSRQRRAQTLPDITCFLDNKLYVLDITVAEPNAVSYAAHVQQRRSFVKWMEHRKETHYVPYMARLAQRYPLRELVPIAVTTGGEIGPAALKFLKFIAGKGVSVTWLLRRLAVLAAVSVHDTYAWYTHSCNNAMNARLGGAAADLEHGDF